MNRDEALELLKGGPDGILEWNRWRLEGEAIPDLSGARLARTDLSGSDLSGTDLSKAHLGETDLTGANLSGADLGGADLRWAKLIGATLEGADLIGAYLREADLSGAKLSDANLSGANLHGDTARTVELFRADLSGADLSGADLSDADLSGAWLREADLSGARLFGTHFREADLNGAHLRRAILHAADLSGANLSGANFEECKCGYTIFGNVNLSSVRALESVQHGGPSSVGVDTLIKSQGKIPEAFLRGCGIPDVWIANIPALLGGMEPIQFYSCFISYSSKDSPFAERLHVDLQNKGVRCWYAPEDLEIGAKIRTRIDEVIRIHDKLLLILSRKSVESDWVEKEVETAMEKERQLKQTVLFPIRLDDAAMKKETGWAADIRRTRHIGDFRKWKDHDAYQEAFAKLLRDLKAGMPPVGKGP